jgi:hypothetical protein
MEMTMQDNGIQTAGARESDLLHATSCRCWRCYSRSVGRFVDRLGSQTAVGQWQFFLTQSYRTRTYAWARGFPRRSEPHPDFVHHFSDYLIFWLAKEFGPPVEFFVADQYGEAGARLHQHFALSGPGLSTASSKLADLYQAGRTNRLPDELKPFQKMLWDRGGFNRILPWLHEASFYIGRYIGRDAPRCYWDWQLESNPSVASGPVSQVGRVVVSPSRDLPAKFYRGGVLKGWHR